MTAVFSSTFNITTCWTKKTRISTLSSAETDPYWVVYDWILHYISMFLLKYNINNGSKEALKWRKHAGLGKWLEWKENVEISKNKYLILHLLFAVSSSKSHMMKSLYLSIAPRAMGCNPQQREQVEKLLLLKNRERTTHSPYSGPVMVIHISYWHMGP